MTTAIVAETARMIRRNSSAGAKRYASYRWELAKIAHATNGAPSSSQPKSLVGTPTPKRIQYAHSSASSIANASLAATQR